MNSIPLCVPFLVLSTKFNELGDMEKHILTPFGGIDIAFRMRAEQTTHPIHYEIEVDGDIDRWIGDSELIEEFRKSLLDFIHGIIRECLDCVGCDKEQFYLRFRGSDFNIRTAEVTAGDRAAKKNGASRKKGACRGENRMSPPPVFHPLSVSDP